MSKSSEENSSEEHHHHHQTAVDQSHACKKLTEFPDNFEDVREWYFRSEHNERLLRFHNLGRVVRPMWRFPREECRRTKHRIPYQNDRLSNFREPSNEWVENFDHHVDSNQFRRYHELIQNLHRSIDDQWRRMKSKSLTSNFTCMSAIDETISCS